MTLYAGKVRGRYENGPQDVYAVVVKEQEGRWIYEISHQDQDDTVKNWVTDCRKSCWKFLRRNLGTLHGDHSDEVVRASESGYLDRAGRRWDALVMGGYVNPVVGILEKCRVSFARDEGCAIVDRFRFNLALARTTGRARCGANGVSCY